MVDSDPQQQLSTAAPPVPESDESTTTNPSMNGLEASNLPPLPPQATASSSSSSSSLPASEVELPPLGAAMSMEEAAAQDAAAHVDSEHQRQASAESTKSGTAGTENASAADGGSKEAVEKNGCAHYKRRAKFVTPCCNKLYMCRYCHDENETHYFNRKTVTQLICTECDTRQRVQAECEKCGVRFGKVSGPMNGDMGNQRNCLLLQLISSAPIET